MVVELLRTVEQPAECERRLESLVFAVRERRATTHARVLNLYRGRSQHQPPVCQELDNKSHLPPHAPLLAVWHGKATQAPRDDLMSEDETRTTGVDVAAFL